MTPLAALLCKHNVTRGRLAQACGRHPSTIDGWVTGKHPPPAYIALTVLAIARKLRPAPLPLDIGVPDSTLRYWRDTGRTPPGALLASAAAAWLAGRIAPCSVYEKRVLSLVLRAGRYYRTDGCWRARPVMGYRLPPLRRATPERLVADGYLKLDGVTLTITEKGRKIVYKR